MASTPFARTGALSFDGWLSALRTPRQAGTKTPPSIAFLVDHAFLVYAARHSGSTPFPDTVRPRIKAPPLPLHFPSSHAGAHVVLAKT